MSQIELWGYGGLPPIWSSAGGNCSLLSNEYGLFIKPLIQADIVIDDGTHPFLPRLLHLIRIIVFSGLNSGTPKLHLSSPK